MGKRGRRKQKTERIQITLYIDNQVDKDIYEHIMAGTSNSAAARELLIDGWMKQGQFKSVITFKEEEDQVIGKEDNKCIEESTELIITYDESFNEIEENSDYEGFLM